MNNAVCDLITIVGERLEASIGEPWNFVSEAGDNKLIGVVSAVSDNTSNDEWLLIKVSPFQYKGKNIQQVIGINRYLSTQDILAELAGGHSVVLNFMFPVDGHELEKNTVLAELT